MTSLPSVHPSPPTLVRRRRSGPGALTGCAAWLTLLAPLAAQFELTPTAGNPILARVPSSWESGLVVQPSVVKVGNTWFMIYTGGRSLTQPMAIGLATSTDGVRFTRHPQNPVFAADNSGFDAFSAYGGVVMHENGQWVMYYGGYPSAPTSYSPGRYVGRATAANLSGPWQRSAGPVVSTGAYGDWDDGWLAVNSVLKTARGYMMFYSAGRQFGRQPHAIGLATSPDGVSWTKYDDPSTTQAPYANSDPVMQLRAASWDRQGVDGPAVVHDGARFEMFYRGLGPSPGLGFAASTDGVTWERCSPAPFAPAEPWHSQAALPALVRVGTEYRVYYTGFASPVDAQIGLATGPAAFESYGAGCPGSGSRVPELRVEGCPFAGERVELSVSGGLGGADGLLVFGVDRGDVAVGGACRLLIDPVLVSLPVQLAGTGPGGGWMRMRLGVPAGISGATVRVQSLVRDPGAVPGFTASNGVRVVFP